MILSHHDSILEVQSLTLDSVGLPKHDEVVE
jgi:hypothetical protein